jgi:SAM-dependent methyltransferase
MSAPCHPPEAASSREEATDLFRRHWDIYRKVVENDHMSHKAAYGVLGEILRTEVDRPFSFADLACGDAYSSSRCLADSQVLEYTGIDLSEWALKLAEQELQRLETPRRLICGRFEELDRYLDRNQDVLWVGLSIHHLSRPEKLRFMEKAKRMLAPGGLFLIYEPIYSEEDSAGTYAERFRDLATGRWLGLTASELDTVCEHVGGFDVPELPEQWIRLGHEAGFGSADRLYTDPTGLYSLFRYA